MQELIGRLIFDPNGKDDLRITGFRRDGKVSLTNEDTGFNTQMTLEDVVALENEAEARGAMLRVERVTCPTCEQWNVGGHVHNWLEEGFDGDEIETRQSRRARLQATVDAAVEALFGEVA